MKLPVQQIRVYMQDLGGPMETSSPVLAEQAILAYYPPNRLVITAKSFDLLQPFLHAPAAKASAILLTAPLQDQLYQGFVPVWLANSLHIVIISAS